MQSLSTADALRSKLLVSLANVHEKIARKKSIESAAEDLKLALEEGICTPEALLEGLMRIQDKIKARKVTKGESVLPVPHHSGYSALNV